MLPVVEIHDISAGVMERVLDFVYTDSFPQGLGAEWLTPAGAEHLFNAADMLLLFSMKVQPIAASVRVLTCSSTTPPTIVKSAPGMLRMGFMPDHLCGAPQRTPSLGQAFRAAFQSIGTSLRHRCLLECSSEQPVAVPAARLIVAACTSQRAVAQAVVQDIEDRARRAKTPGLEQLCRYLLVADTYSVLVRTPPCLSAGIMPSAPQCGHQRGHQTKLLSCAPSLNCQIAHCSFPAVFHSRGRSLPGLPCCQRTALALVGTGVYPAMQHPLSTAVCCAGARSRSASRAWWRSPTGSRPSRRGASASATAPSSASSCGRSRRRCALIPTRTRHDASARQDSLPCPMSASSYFSLHCP